MHETQTFNICKNCSNHYTGKYCNQCGEKAYSEHDKSLKHFVEEFFHFFTHVEGTLINTLKVVITKPGKLSLDYCNGIRKKYYKPMSFFLLLVILYLIFPLFEGLNMKLNFYAHHDLFGDYAARQIKELLQTKHYTEAQLAEIFHHKGELVSKFLLFIIIPVMALFGWMLGLKKRKLFYDNFIFSTETASFFLLWGFLLFPLFITVLNLLHVNFIFISEPSTIIGIVSVFMVYVTLAAKRFFNFSWWYSVLFSLLFTVTLSFFIEYIYKLILFVITINLIK